MPFFQSVQGRMVYAERRVVFIGHGLVYSSVQERKQKRVFFMRDGGSVCGQTAGKEHADKDTQPVSSYVHKKCLP